METVTHLRNTIEEIEDKYPDCLIFLRGDCNVNPNNQERVVILKNLMNEFNLTKIPINHKTYHHFLGGGAFDSSIDIILQSSKATSVESISTIFCSQEWPLIDSHHDIIVSSVNIPVFENVKEHEDLVAAPKLEIARQKVIWSDDGIKRYTDLVTTLLPDIRLKWLNPLSRTSLSVLLESTNDILNRCAAATNKTVDLNLKHQQKSEKKPLQIRRSEAFLKRVFRQSKARPTDTHCQDQVKLARKKHRALIRELKIRKERNKDENLFSLLSSNPHSAFKVLKSAKSTASVQLPYLKVGNKKYQGDKVIDGFYESLSLLKTLNLDQLESSPHHLSLMDDYRNIKYLCDNKIPLPQVSLKMSTSILKRIKPRVTDIFSITALHFINAGYAGLVHFNLLLNTFILDVNNCSIKELNTVYALLLYKAHNKDRVLDTSYRTISTCPLLAKGLDVHISDISLDFWNKEQAPTQYQGQGSCHELASLLVSEAILSSKSENKPIFLLFLDAKSAFDSVFIPYLIRRLYMSGMAKQALLYLDNRLSSRVTVCEWDKAFVGPIVDEHGLEQGGVYSSDGYKIYNNELLLQSQASGLGVKFHNVQVVSAVGQADDTVLMSDSISKLNLLLQLCLNYCKKYCVELSPSKTKLMVIPPGKKALYIPYNPLKIAGEKINFVEEAEHVGVLRSIHGNTPNIVQRISSFKKALGILVSCGLAQGRRSNPTVSLRILSTYCTPVLLSGLASLVLSSSEVASIDQQFKLTLQNIQKLKTSSPSALVHFVAGSLPLTAILHIRQISLLGMISRLQQDPLHTLAHQALLTSPSLSWFTSVRNLMQLYQLPHPLTILNNPPTKDSFKKLVKAKILDYWEKKLRAEAALLPSLNYFYPQFMSLCHPHKLWTTAGNNHFQVTKARVQLLFLSNQ